MAAPAKLITTSVGFQDAKGTVVASGLLTLTLSQPAEVVATGGQVDAQPINLLLDANGKISSTAIWFNDELTPSGTTYHAVLYAANFTTILADLGQWSIVGASADLSLMVPTTIGASYPAPVLLTPAGDQHITNGFNLTTPQFNSIIWVDGTKYTTIAAAQAALPGAIGIICVPPNYSETLAANLVLTKNQHILFWGPAAITMGSFSITVAHGQDGVSIKSIQGRGYDGNSLGVTFTYTGTGTAFSIGDNTANTFDVYFAGFSIKTPNSGSSVIALALNSVQDSVIERVTIAGGSNSGQIGLALDGTVNFCGRNLFNSVLVNAYPTGIRMAANSNFNKFFGAVGNTPAAGTAISITSGNGNWIFADIEGAPTAVSLANSSNVFGNRITIYGQGNTTDYSIGAAAHGNILDNVGAFTGSEIIVSGTGVNNVIVNPYKNVVSSGAGITDGIGFANSMPQIYTATFGALAFDGSANTKVRSNSVLGWSSSGADPSAAANDVGFSRLSAGNLALGNGTANDTTANLQLGKVTKYNGSTTAGSGLASILGSTSQKSESAADTNVLTVTPPALAGMYRLTFVLDVSAATAATLGWTATWKDSNGNAQAPTNLTLEQSGTAAPALTFVLAAAGVLYGEASISIDNSATNIVIKLTFTGTSFTAKCSAIVERLI